MMGYVMDMWYPHYFAPTWYHPRCEALRTWAQTYPSDVEPRPTKVASVSCDLDPTGEHPAQDEKQQGIAGGCSKGGRIITLSSSHFVL
jgi:hypothetical protein